MNRRSVARLGWVAGIAAAAAVGALAGRATFVPPQVEERVLPAATATVTEGSVGSAVPVGVLARWETTPLATGAATGTVTSIDATGAQLVEAGDVLYAVDLRPVVVAQGATPAFRELAQGIRGDDVRQLQQFLHDAGYFHGQVNGVFGGATRVAVQAWQRSLGLERTGVVQAGDLVFVPELPARVVLADEVTIGAQVAPGQTVLSLVAAAPVFTAEVSNTMQAGAIPVTGSEIDVEQDFGGPAWVATVAGQTPNEFGGSSVLSLVGRDGGPVCGTDCDRIPFTNEDLTFAARAVISPEISGPSVPAAAVGTAADGSRFVVAPDSQRIPVTVLAGDATRLIVDGVEVGDTVQLFADAPVVSDEISES